MGDHEGFGRARGARASKVTAAATLLSCLALGCALHGRYRQCDEPTARAYRARLSDTGLYADVAAGTLADGVRPFTPNWELWSDGASKQRWVYLPPGARVDERDPDAWQFPEGTRFWKEFRQGGVRIETRMLQKVGALPEDWLAVSYLWKADGSDADAVPSGVVDARGTTHDVPAAATCMGCHGGTVSRVLGYSAVQLAEPRDDSVATRAAGYLHANCGHCHNSRRPAHRGARCYDPEGALDLSLTTRGSGGLSLSGVIRPGDADGSALVRRMSRSSRFRARMPPLATETIDADGLALVRRWITEGATRRFE